MLMKYTIKNLIGSPYNVPTAEGVVHIPAHGEVTAEFDAVSLRLIKSMEIFDVSDFRDPLDHDGDGKKGGSLPAEKRGPGRPKKEQS